MNLLAFISFAVFAAETIISPIADIQPLPTVSFGELLSYTPPQVLGTTVEVTPTPTPRPTRKDNFTIAVLGDSMVDTLGVDLGHIKADLKAAYPGVAFAMLNYGVGGENIESGISRLTNDYDYLGHHSQSLLSQKPDIVIIESFGYNPFIDPSSELDRHWLDMAKIVDMIKGNIPGVKIVIAATIAPNAAIFGDGVLNWNPTEKQEKVARIKNYLENAIKFAKSQHLPLANLYTLSLQADGNGKLEYINPGDHIHYSDRGRELFGKVVSETIVSHKLLE